MKRNYDPRKVKIHRSYTPKDIGEQQDVDTHTVLRWIREGRLMPAGGRVKPYVIPGITLKDFLTLQSQNQKRPCKPGELYCPSCVRGQKSAPESLRLIPEGKDLGYGRYAGRLEGRCKVCKCKQLQYCAYVEDREGGFMVLQPNRRDRPVLPTKMTAFNVQNERIKNQYRRHLEGPGKHASNTIEQKLRSLDTWDEFHQRQDFYRFTIDDARAFKSNLETKLNQRTKKPLSLATQNNTLTSVREFYLWLWERPGYKRRIDIEKVGYFTLSREQGRMAMEARQRPVPTIAIIKQVVDSISGDSEVAQRDRAMLSYAILVGARIDAMRSMPLGCLDLEKLLADQDPLKGVKTKRKKRISSFLIVFDEELLSRIVRWVKYLREVKGFVDNDPLFPSTHMEQKSPDTPSFVAFNVSRDFWKHANAARNVFRKRFKEAGLDYYIPHSFRNAAIKAAGELCTTAIEIKAVSDNFGHQDVRTTLNYIALSENEKGEIMKNLPKRASKKETDLTKRIIQIIRDVDKNDTEEKGENKKPDL